MQKVSLRQGYATAGKNPAEVWLSFEADWREKAKGCALVRVNEILGLKQSGKGWAVTYRIGDAKITQPIRPDLALELLDEEMVGRTSIPSTYFVINPQRVEEAVVVTY